MRRKTICLTLFPVLLLGMAAPRASGITGLGFGLRGGVIPNLDDPNTGESIDNLPFIGAHLKIGTLPIIDFEADVSYAKKSYTYNVVEHGVELWSGKVKFHDLSLNASAQYGLPLSLLIAKPYVGGGMGMHLLGSSSDIGIMPAQISLDFDPNYAPTKNSFHLLAGLKFHIPMIPFDLFAEGRYTIVQTDPKTKYNSLYAGFTLNLP